MTDAVHTPGAQAKIAGSAGGALVRRVGLFAFVLMAGMISVIVGNYSLDPFTYNRAALVDMSAFLAADTNYALLDPNINMRALKREHIRQMRTTPDVVLFGGSRFQHASAALLPGRKLFNAFVHNDSYEDLLAITELLRANDRLPKTLVLSVRFASVTYPTDWKEWAPEYRSMARLLGLQDPGWFNTFAFDKWTNLLSLDGAMQKWDVYRRAPKASGPVAALSDPTRDIIGAEGTLYFSEERDRLDTVESAYKSASTFAALDRNRKQPLDAAMVDGLERLLVYLKGRGVRVILVELPFHPHYWQGISDYPRGAYLQRLWREVSRVGEKLNIESVGNLDPRIVGCGEAEFRDAYHAKSSCLGKVFASISNL
jgi:hypothetical protein